MLAARERHERKDDGEYCQFVKVITIANDAAINFDYSYILQADANKSKFLIDGFPRNQDNLEGWIKQMQEKVDLKFVLFFECTEAVCIERCLSRNSGRSDDNIESLKKRFDVFYHDSMPIVNYYDSQNLVRKIDGIPPPDQVFENVKAAFADYNAQ